jgi:transposase
MIQVEEREAIRRAHFVEGKTIRQIARELGHSRPTVRQALEGAEPSHYTLSTPRPAPRLGAYRATLDRLLEENKQLPHKQRYTIHKMYVTICAAGYTGAESTVRGYVGRQRRDRKRAVYLPLEFDPGTDAQVDWGEGDVIFAGVQTTVQLFFMRLCCARRVFVKAYPAQKQEAFFDGHVQAFEHFQGVPQRITYDNLKAAVLRVLQGSNRQEQQAFIVFRSHYLFESNFCTPGEGHEKGGVEHSVGFDRRNFMVPLPEVASFDELNAHLLACCLADDERQVTGQPTTIGAAWKLEQPHLRPRPAWDFECCTSLPVILNPYSQVVFATNRYSVPTDQAYRELTLKAYPLRVEVLHDGEVIARHARSYEREQDVFEPLHYLSLLEQRPGAFEHAKPIRRWRAEWPPTYEQLLARLRADQPDGRGLREFIQILMLHCEHPAEQMEQAIQQALDYGGASLDGVRLCLHQLTHPAPSLPVLDLTDQPQLTGVGDQPLDLGRYNELFDLDPSADGIAATGVGA